MKYDKENFIKDAIAVHKNKYDYNKVEYINKTTKVEIICNKCGSTFWQTPKNHLRGQGCPKCGAEYARNWSKGNYSAFIEKANELYGNKYSFPNISSEYENNKSAITVRCNRCGYEFKQIPNYILNKKTPLTCRKCKNSISYDDIKTLANGNDIVPFEGFIDRTVGDVTAICPIHGEYKAMVKSVLKGKYACKKCAGSKTLTDRKVSYDEFLERLKERYRNAVTPFEEDYKDTITPMRFKCNSCGSIFKRTPNAFMFAKHKNPCPICSKREIAEKQTKTTEQFIKDAIAVWGEDKFDFSETRYTKSNEKVKMKCNECGRTFEIEANSFLSGLHGCPYHNCNSSIKEKEISEFISSLGVTALTNDRNVLDGTELDVFVPSFNVAFEFDGIFWHNELYKDKNYHLDKMNKCIEHGIHLVHIFEDEWLHKKEIWKSMIANMLNKTQNRIYARKCTVKEVGTKEASIFLNDNHIQGNCGSAIRYGLYYNDELVSLMTFGKTRHFIGNDSHEYELLRFCNKLNTNVIGGASRLLKHFIEDHDPKNIVSYADRRWSSGNLYDALGFTLYNVSKPNYFYVIDNKRHNRFNFRKSILMKKYGCPKEMSERDFCKSQKWWRIYDCGALCYEWNKSSN